MGIEEAKKQSALENHTVNSIIRIINENNIVETVDLVSGGHIQLLFTEKEVTASHADYELAKESGIDISQVEYFSTDEAQTASILDDLHGACPLIIFFIRNLGLPTQQFGVLDIIYGL